MPVNLSAVLREGAERSVARNGLVLMGLLFVLSAINGLVGAGAARLAAGTAPIDVSAQPLLVLSPLLVGIVSLLTGLASLLVTLAAIRVFVSDETERLPRETVTRNGVPAVLNYVVGSIVFAIVVGLGFVALVIPGIFLLVTLAFWTVFVAVEDENFVTGFRRSWTLTRGHRLRLLLLGIAVLLLTIAVSVVFSFGGVIGGSIGSLLAAVGAAIGGAVTTVFSLAALAAAYNQLVALRDEGGDLPTGEHTSPPEDTTGAV